MKSLSECILVMFLATATYGSPTPLPSVPPGAIAARDGSTGATQISCSPTYSTLTNGAPTNFCTCNNGDQRPYAPAGAEKYTPCPATIASPTQKATTTSELHFAYTETDPYGIKTAIIACETSSVADFGASPVTMCAGREVVLTGSTQFPVQPTLQVTAAKATSTYVGSITGSTLYSSVTSALSNVLPSAATPTNYKGGTAVIPNIQYPDGEGGVSTGNLELTVDWAQFQNGSMHDKMIHAAALSVTQTLKAKGACKDKKYPQAEGREIIEATWNICQVAGAYNLQYFDGVQLDGATDFVGFTLEFKGSQDGEDITDEVCDDIMTAIDFLAALAAFFFPPAYLVDETAVKDLVQAGCGIAKDVQNGIHHVTSIIGG